MQNGTLPDNTATSISTYSSGDRGQGEKGPTSKTVEVDAGSHQQGKHDSSQQHTMKHTPSIRTPKEYEEHVVAITAQSRKSFNFGSQRRPRADSDIYKNLPPVPPSPHTIERGDVPGQNPRWPMTHYEN